MPGDSNGEGEGCESFLGRHKEEGARAAGSHSLLMCSGVPQGRLRPVRVITAVGTDVGAPLVKQNSKV